MDIKKIDEITDKIESFVCTVYNWTRTHQALVKLGFGGVILLYSPRLSCTLLVMSCIKGVGMPLVQQSFSELYQSYKQAKACVKEEAPALEKAMTEVKSITKEVRELETIIKELQAMKTPDVEKIKTNLDKAKKDITKLTSVSSNAMDVAKRINSKVNYKSIQKVLHDLYIVSLSALASVNSSSIAKCSIGISLGSTVTTQLQCLIKKYEASIQAQAKKIDDKLEGDSDNISSQIAGALLEPDKVVSQLNSAAYIIGNSIGLSVSLYATAFSRLLAATTIGADMVVSASEELLEPLLIAQDLQAQFSIKSNAAILSSILAGLGVAYNVYAFIPGTGGYGAIANALLTPLLLVEHIACMVVVAK